MHWEYIFLTCQSCLIFSVASSTFFMVLHYFQPSLSFTVTIEIYSRLHHCIWFCHALIFSPHFHWSGASKATNSSCQSSAESLQEFPCWSQATFLIFKNGKQSSLTSGPDPSLQFCLLSYLALQPICIFCPYQDTMLSFASVLLLRGTYLCRYVVKKLKSSQFKETEVLIKKVLEFLTELRFNNQTI